MVSNLIMDGNFLLNKMVFRLEKSGLLPELYAALINQIEDYRKLYPFADVYFVSDSREGYWRKKMYPEYKATRKKDTRINWKFVFDTYQLVKEELKSMNMHVLEYKGLEGDDWITYITHRTNMDGRNAFIAASDVDLTQLLTYGLSPQYINIMFSINSNNKKVYFPTNYNEFLISLQNSSSSDVFDIFEESMNDNKDFLNFVNQFSVRDEVVEVDIVETLVKKILSGDAGDNIKSFFQKERKDGKMMGIGEAGAEKLYKKYFDEFGIIDVSNDEHIDNMIDLVCEDKKVLVKDHINVMREKWQLNRTLMQLDVNTLPKPAINKMKELYEHSHASKKLFG